MALAAAGVSEDVLAGLVPGQFASGYAWRDTDGNPIDAHGGCILFHEGIYYWYGEAKTGRTFLPDCNKSWGGTRVDMAGVSCYSSTDLFDWKNEGLALPPAAGAGDLNSSNVVERPKVVFNRNSKRFVMWMHIDSADYHEARLGVAVSEKPAGPFKYLGSFRPDAGVWPLKVTDSDKTPGRGNYLARDFQNGQMARDMTVFVDDDGKAYIFYASEENATMHVTLLSDDYLRTRGQYSRILIGRSREAPAVFKHNGKYYLITSGSTAWDPNAARAAVADSIFGPWKESGNPCIGPNADKTFLGQSSFVLPVTGSNTLIFIADRWNKRDLSNSSYLWLPIEFDEDDKPVVTWRDNWSLSMANTVNVNQHTSSDP
jgi:beta-xylosidase